MNILHVVKSQPIRLEPCEHVCVPRQPFQDRYSTFRRIASKYKFSESKSILVFTCQKFFRDVSLLPDKGSLIHLAAPQPNLETTANSMHVRDCARFECPWCLCRTPKVNRTEEGGTLHSKYGGALTTGRAFNMSSLPIAMVPHTNLQF